MSQLLVCIGLISDVVGTLLVGYEIIWGYKKRLQDELSLLYLSSLADAKKVAVDINTKLPCPPYTREQIDNIVADVNSSYDEAIQQTKIKQEKNSKDFTVRRFKYGWMGLSFLVAGFVLQFIGTLVKSSS